MKIKSFMIIKVFSAFLLLLCFCAGCKKNISTTEPTERLNKPVQLINTLYPMTPGSTWTYAAYDSVGNQTDTVNIKILNTTRDDSAVKSLLLICGKYETDSAWVVQSFDTVSFHFKRIYHLDDMTLLYPLTIGNSWKYLSGTVIVEPDDSVTTPAAVFPCCKHIKRSGYATNEFSNEEFWIDPMAGIVKIRQNDFVTLHNGYETNKVWTLISYNIK